MRETSRSAEVKWLGRVRLFATPWTVAHQALPSVGFSRQEYWSGLHLLPRRSSWPRDRTQVSRTADRRFNPLSQSNRSAKDILNPGKIWRCILWVLFVLYARFRAEETANPEMPMCTAPKTRVIKACYL